jgi:hypothetical protein
MELSLSVVGAGPGPSSESVNVASKRRCNVGGGLLRWTEEGGVTVDRGCLKRTNTTVSGAQAEKEQIVNLACVRFEVVEKKVLVDFEDPLITTDMTESCRKTLPVICMLLNTC